MGDDIRVAIGQFNELSDERLRFAQQIGVTGVLLNTPKLPGEQRWEFKDLMQMRVRVEEYGLRLEALENTPITFYIDAIVGGPARDEQIANYQETIRNMGRAGIPILGYHWMANSVWRTSRTAPGRGGAQCTAFDMRHVETAPLSHGRVFTNEEMEANHDYFLRAVLPVAEEFNVKLALHPDDPPGPALGGVARIMSSFEGFKRAMDTVPSPNHGLDFCMGCWSEMGPGALPPMQYFAERGKILYVHFRDVQGVMPAFQECFLGEGNTDVVAAMVTLKKAGFTGFLIDDHVPHMDDDTPWGHRGRAQATGYICGLLNAVNKLVA
ncbi:MAG: mannonate dehydratase [Chloroflexi bacterium]|nr:mannonate dehydratase [Chloroflexota bacterium]